MDKVLVGLLVATAFLLGVSLSGSGQNWIDAPTEGYAKPKCPPGYAPKFFGVIVNSGVSSPIYECLYGYSEGEQVSWGELQSASTAQPG